MCHGSKMTVISLQEKKFSEAVIAFLHQVKYYDQQVLLTWIFKGTIVSLQPLLLCP